MVRGARPAEGLALPTALQRGHALRERRHTVPVGRAVSRSFRLRIGTAFRRSNVLLRKWATAIYLEMISLTGVSSLKLDRDIGITQRAA